MQTTFLFKHCAIHSMNYFLYLSVALNISYSLLSAAELRDGITKQPSTYV